MKKLDMKNYLMFSSKSFLRLVRISSKMYVIPSLVVYPSDRCNYKCLMCDSGEDGGNKKSMSIEMFRKIIDETSHYLIKPKIHLSGLGEPLLYGDITELMKYCGDNKMRWSMTTNGYLLSKFADAIVKHNCSALNISIHGTEDDHNAITKVDNAYNTVIDGLAKLVATKKSYATNSPVVAINCVVTSINVDKMFHVLDEMIKLPVNSITFQHPIFSPSTIDSNEFLIREEEPIGKLVDFVKYVYALNATKKINVFPRIKVADIPLYYSSSNELFKQSCVLPWLTARIYPSGDVGVCGEIFGNIQNDTIAHLVNNEVAVNFRNRLQRGENVSTKCFRCCHRHYY